MSISITLPLPPKELSPNWRGHWAKKAKATRDTRALAMWKAFDLWAAQSVTQWKRASVQIHWHTRTIAHPDADNALASCKPIFDGMTDAGLFADDKGLTHLPIIFAKDAKNPRIVLTVEETK